MICSPWRTTTTPPLDCFGNLIRGTVGIQKTPSVNSRVVFFVFCAWRSSSPTRGVRKIDTPRKGRFRFVKIPFSVHGDLLNILSSQTLLVLSYPL